MKERLQKVMAEFGVASRRKSEELISLGHVKVNGLIIRELGYKVDKEVDSIEVEGRAIKNQSKKVYILLNKPVGYITSAKDQFNRPTVLDLIKELNERVFPVGRLDYDTEGLLILTNDGELTYKITHPKHNVDKTYRALIKGIADKKAIESFRKGLRIEDYVTAPAKLEIIKYEGNNTVVNITIHEGKNRQVRKMCSHIGHEVIRLKRIRIGKITLGDLKRGQWRYLCEEEINYLYKLGGISNDSN